VTDTVGREGEGILVVGSGIAGLTFALKAAELGPVLVVTKKARADSSTNYARGGMAAALGPDDDPELHLRDTLAAGDGLCRRDRVEMVVREGPLRVRELVEWGIRFQREGEGFSLGREGGHSRRRILHAGDRTGREIERALLAAVAASDRIRVLEDVDVVDLLVEGRGGDASRCVGVLALDHRRGRRMALGARATVLAAGGCGQVYRHTTNPAIATGDGIAMAYRAGARVGNMEFIQFHPTALYPAEDPAFLLSEAIRGEGAVLRLLDGTPFMERHDPRGSLAPRDVVARAIHLELLRTGDPHVVLDISPVPRKVMEERFPGAVEGCLARDVDLFGQGIPVVPAAHYVCGGILTDESGRSSLPGLFAIGEVACTGVHGANRLASNSLLEAVVFAHRAFQALEGDGGRGAGPGRDVASAQGAPIPEGDGAGSPLSPDELDRIGRVRSRLRDLMWTGAGIVRSDRGLGEAAGQVAAMLREEEERWAASAWTLEGAELRNLLQVAALIVASARARKESRGLHYNVDHPRRDDRAFLGDTVLERGTGVDPGSDGADRFTTGEASSGR
jgi:L-aspartate oxidase